MEKENQIKNSIFEISLNFRMNTFGFKIESKGAFLLALIMCALKVISYILKIFSG